MGWRTGVHSTAQYAPLSDSLEPLHWRGSELSARDSYCAAECRRVELFRSASTVCYFKRTTTRMACVVAEDASSFGDIRVKSTTAFRGTD